jgi:hypothetical protein
MVIFANRAYTAEAKVLMVRIDDAGMTYDDPLVVIDGEESVMSVSASVAGAVTKSFYLWRTDHWIQMEGQNWLSSLSAFIPSGMSVRQTSSWPDLETMSAQVSLFKKDDADCCPSGGLANIKLGLAKEQFTVKQVKVNSIQD